MGRLQATDAREARPLNIIDMAVRFTAMSRVFENGSSETIKTMLQETVPAMASASSEKDFRRRHKEFCRCFVGSISTAGRRKDGRIVKAKTHASYGHGAKILDVVLKVYVYYCQLPDPETAQRTLKWLNAAIDTQMLKDLKKRLDRRSRIRANTIEGVDARTYVTLQELVRQDIGDSPILPVQWGASRFRTILHN